MNGTMIRTHLTNLLMGATSINALQELGTPEALEAVTISARNFNDVTMQARDIYSAMGSTFVTKIKASPANYALMRKHGICEKGALLLVGKKVEFKINWSWSTLHSIYLSPVTPLPNGYNGYSIPLECVLQNRDAAQCRKLVKWVLDRVAITQAQS